MTGAVLALNAGSSSLKFALYDIHALDCLLRGVIEGIGAKRAEPELRATGQAAALFVMDSKLVEGVDHEGAGRWLIDAVGERLPHIELAAVGHRVVHGGTDFEQPVRVTPTILKQLEALAPLAPQHQPHNLAAIRSLFETRPGLPQIACFDTAFHLTQPRLAQLFPLPRAFADRGVIRYGFHGLSYEFIASELRRLDREKGRAVVAHLGHGASLCAMRDLKSHATTMGFSTLDGLMMGTRSGAIDPGLLLHLLLHEKMAPEALSKLLYEEAGLLGVSGVSDDLRILEASADEAAQEATELFAYRAACEIGALAAALGGLDHLVFTGGIGENSARMRARICTYLGFLDVAIDEDANQKSAPTISAAASKVDILVIPTNEEIIVARAARASLRD